MNLDRRAFLKIAAGVAGSSLLSPMSAFAHKAGQTLVTKKISSSNVALPVIGMGTWITFNVGNSQRLRDARTEVLREFFHGGGGMIDSSPMYGSAEAVVGYALEKIGEAKTLFSATKVWTSSVSEAQEQIRESHRLWRVKRFDLLQVHNLEGWRDHLKTLFRMKENGELRHVGVTTSHGLRHEELERIMRSEPIDFVQLTYNMVDRDAETRLLGLGQERGIAVIANRPFDGGYLVRRLKTKPLPAWASEFDCHNWPQFLLKFIVSHPAITCAIPATTRVEHMRENMGACVGRLPDAAMRARMVSYLSSL
jgi:diketogulonate reductase-like aldo/keto reductase